MTRFDLIVFDLDGTLIDSLQDLTTAANHVRTIYTLPLLSLKEMRSFIGNGVKALMALVLPNVSVTQRQHGLQLFLEYYSTHLLDATVLYPGISTVISGCRHGTMAVLTNKQEVHSRVILKGLGIFDDFALVWGSDTMNIRKPAPDALIAMMSKLGVAPNKTVLIGDGVNDVLCAQSAGVHSIAVGYGYGEYDSLIQLHPDLFVEHPQELMEAVCFG
ncbi:MAG: HAD-IA family hydrolase [Elusimicrobia bacterium]|nr:HAD-IA family hydrolase [Elusimicrobiota bacterium]